MANNVPPTAAHHVKVTFGITNDQEGEILIALLADIGFEGFEQTDKQVLAYIPQSVYDEEQIKAVTGRYDYDVEIVPAQNWNAQWESNFQPVVIDDFCTVRAHFHQMPVTTPYEIVITPKMSFGTGHHATTRLVMKLMKELDFRGKQVLDFGTGTGILAILAEKLGAAGVLAIDNDEWSVENSRENIEQNECKRVTVKQGSLEDNTAVKTEIIIANINRNVLLNYMPLLYRQLSAGGDIIMSGLLSDDRDTMLAAAKDVGFRFIKEIDETNWIALCFRK